MNHLNLVLVVVVHLKVVGCGKTKVKPEGHKIKIYVKNFIKTR